MLLTNSTNSVCDNIAHMTCFLEGITYPVLGISGYLDFYFDEGMGAFLWSFTVWLHSAFENSRNGQLNNQEHQYAASSSLSNAMRLCNHETFG